MNGLLKKVHLVLFVLATMVGQVNALGVRKTTGSTQRGSAARVNRARAASPVARVNKATDTLGQILVQAEEVCTATGPKAHKERATAKAEIKRLMASLDKKIVNVISDDIDIIYATSKTEESKQDASDAYNRLVAIVDNIRAQAKVVKTIVNEQRKVQNAPAEKKEEVAAQSVQNIKAAEAEAKQAGYLSRAASGVASLVTTPVNYVFGEESSKAKTAFYATVGVAAIGGAIYMGVPAMAVAKAKAAYDAATWANAKEVPGALWAGAKATPGKLGEWSSSAWNAAKTGLGYGNTASSAVRDLTAMAGLAQSAYVVASNALKNDPTNPELIAKKTEAFNKMMEAHDELEQLKKGEKIIDEMRLKEQEEILAEVAAEAAANDIQREEQQEILKSLKQAPAK